MEVFRATLIVFNQKFCVLLLHTGTHTDTNTRKVCCLNNRRQQLKVILFGIFNQTHLRRKFLHEC